MTKISIQQERLIEELSKEYSICEISNLVGVCRRTVNRVLCKKDLGVRKCIARQIELMISHYPELSARQIANILGVSKTTVLRHAGYHKKSRQLSDDEIDEIQRLYKRTLSIKEVADRLGHCPKTVKKYLPT